MLITETTYEKSWRSTETQSIQQGHLTDIMNGKVASHQVNVDNTLAIGEQMLQKFRADLPDTFHRPIKKEVVTMEWPKKEVQVGTTNIYDMEKLYAGLLVISQSRDIHLSHFSNMNSHQSRQHSSMNMGIWENEQTYTGWKLAVFPTMPLELVDLNLLTGMRAIYHTSWQWNTTLENFVTAFLAPFEKPITCTLCLMSLTKNLSNPMRVSEEQRVP